MKTYRERFIKNHRQERQLANTKKGYKNVLIYTGDFYTWEPPKGTITSIRRMFAILELITIILFVLSSIPGSLISYSHLVMTGAILSIVAWAFEAYGAAPFCFAKLPMQEDDFSHAKWMFRVATPIRFVCLMFATVTGLIYLAEKGFETTGTLALIGYFLTALIALYLFISSLKLSKYVKIVSNPENPDPKKDDM